MLFSANISRQVVVHHNSFVDKLRDAQESSSSLLCVGLDPDPKRLPAAVAQNGPAHKAVLRFCLDIVDATSDYACAFKINFAFFEALGPDGWDVLERVTAAIPESKIKIADAKRGDIGNTGRFYAQAIFDRLDFDACTVSPYMGRSSVEPFLQYRGKAAFVLALTSNEDAREIQAWPGSERPLYLHVAASAIRWEDGAAGQIGLVVGGTDAEGLAAVRTICPTTPFLVPGIGAQGAEVSDVLRAGLTPAGPLLINSSRGILYAGAGKDFASYAARAARTLRDEINAVRLE